MSIFDKRAEEKKKEQDAFNAAMNEPPEPLERDDSLLSADEIAAIQAEARAKVDKEIKALATKRLMSDAVLAEKVRRGIVKEADIVGDIPVTIDVAEFTDRIMLDFRVYLHGHTYMVSPAVAATLHEVMARTQRHQNELDGKGREGLRKRNMQMSAKTGIVTNAHGLMGRP